MNNTNFFIDLSREVHGEGRHSQGLPGHIVNGGVTIADAGIAFEEVNI